MLQTELLFSFFLYGIKCVKSRLEEDGLLF